LEIYADDVKCSHGTTTGQMDEEALFYLRARGVGEQSARKMMVHAFASDVLTRMKSEAVRNYAEHIMEERFHWNN
jgi:Fe-S cluster assembly protein SufD